MNKKKILVLIDWYLPGFKAGGPIRSCVNMVDYLSNEFDFYIVTSDTDYMSDSPYESVKTNEWNILENGSSVYYISKQNLNPSTIKRLINEVGADYYYLNGVFSYLFTIIPLKNISDRNKIIVAVRGMLAPSAIAIKYLKKKLFFFYSKIIGLFDGITFQASSSEEKKQIEQVFLKSKIEIAPNLPMKISTITLPKRLKQQGEVRLLNVARIAPEKNLLFTLNLLKQVQGKVIFDFYGTVYDRVYANRCFSVIANLPKNISVAYRGEESSEKIIKLMENYHFLFMPSRGENFGHIIFEAMSAGLPVIISDKTPWKDLKTKNAGWDISLEDSSAFIQTIEQCVQMKESEYETYSKGAFTFASEYINNREKIEINRRLFS